MSQSPVVQHSVGQISSTLDAVRRWAQTVWLATAVLGFAGSLLLLLILAVVIDHYLVLPALARLLLLAMVIGVPVFVLRRALQVKPGGSLEETALLVERRFPTLDNGLINSLQLAAMPADGAEAIVEAIVTEGRDALGRVAAREAISRRRLTYAAGAAALGVLLFGGQMMLDPHALGDGLSRVFLPLGDNTLTRILDVTPGDTDVLVSSDVEVTATIGGRVPLQAQLLCTLPDGRTLNLPMLAPHSATPDRLAGKIERLGTDLKYRVVAGDARSRWFQLRARQRPVVQKIAQTITPPDYIQARPKEETGGTIRAVIGSKVQLRVSASEPFKEGKLVFGDGREQRLVSLAPAPGGATQPAEGMGVGVAQLVIEHPDKYSLEIVGAFGFASERTSYDIVPLEDKAPQVNLAQPGQDVSVQIDDTVVVLVEASDDYALRNVQLVQLKDPSATGNAGAGAADTKDQPKVLATWDLERRDQQRLTREFRLQVAQFGLSDATPIVLQAMAHDFCPSGHVGLSGPVTIRLKDPTQTNAAATQPAGYVSLAGLIAKQRTNLTGSEALWASWQPATTKPANDTAAREDLPALAARQEEIRRDAVAIAGDAATKNPELQRRLTNLAETLMQVAVEQLRRCGSTPANRAKLPLAIDTQRAILQALVVAEASQQNEMAQGQRRQVAEMLAELIAKQLILRTDTGAGAKGGTPEGLEARQRVLARDAVALSRQLQGEVDAGAGGNEELVTQYKAMLAVYEKQAVRGNMLIAAERLGADARDDAKTKQDEVLAALADMQTMFRKQALAEAKKELAETALELSEAKGRLDKLAAMQAAITEIAKDLKKTPDLRNDKTDVKDKMQELKEARDALKDATEQLAKDLHLLPDQSVSNDLIPEMNEVYEKVKQAAGSENDKPQEIAVDRDEGTLAAFHEAQKHMGERAKDVEQWLPDRPDAVKWNQESFDKNEMGKVPLGDLPDKLDDIIGDMLEQAKDLQDKSQDSASNVGFPDATMGWDIGDGPMPSWAAKGKSGNTPPNSNEQTGRSGSGREGKSDGEIVGDTLKALKGSETEVRRTQDGFQSGELKEEDNNPMKAKATGGGKLAGSTNNQGMAGAAPIRDELKYRNLERQQTMQQSTAKSIYTKAKLLRLPTGELDRAVLEMDAANRRLQSGDVAGFARAQEAVVRALKETKAKLTGQAVIEAPGTTHVGAETAGATNELIPKSYENSVADYMRKIAEQP